MKKSPLRYLTATAMMAATVSCAKLALSFLPNVEIVTLLLALYGYTFGGYGVLAAFVFVAVEPLLYGFGLWTVTYFLYWPLVAAVFRLLGRRGVRSPVWLTLAAVWLTVWFGVLSSLVDTGLLTGYFDRFFRRFAVLYARGVGFYIAQIACNAVLFPLLFRPLSAALGSLKTRLFTP